MIIENETFVEIECTNAEQLIERLTETSPHFQGAEDVRLFRGESDISRPLIPSAFRPQELRKLIDLNSIEVRGPFVACDDESKCLGRWFHEKMAVALFYKYANEQGLPLPWDRQRRLQNP